MVFGEVEDIVKITGETITGLVSELTGMKIVEKIAGGLQGITNQGAKLVKEVPIAGGLAMYVFKQGGKGFVVLGKKVDEAIETLGDLANTVVGTAQDTLVFILETTEGSLKQVGKTVGAINGGRRHRSKSHKVVRKHKSKHGKKSHKNVRKHTKKSRKHTKKSRRH